ncbi:TIGR02285 family protein [Pseudoalteromonas denitrificans]|uniref:Uncharacterized protein n=1 Tax=Pseudoalteromonas denitrificans DSM 6059 TaxID=1123010 RepID=A0A1I1QY73_9GAMM|nr:TIGR02285 family protein [Pseudoalteromonas denitrificans]SFD27056.1 conserved hypothetical protein [Pseudoalteromonas denitrificans DSM 6059]
MGLKVSLWLTILIFSSPIHAKETIQWMYSDFPPAFIVKGENTGKGYVDLTQKLLINALPEYRHIKIKANYARSNLELSQKDNICHAALLKTAEREKFTEFSIAAYIVFGNKLIINQHDNAILKPYFMKNKTIDLASLMASGDFKLGIAKGAKYGTPIDQILKSHFNKVSIFERSAEDHFSGLSKMLSLKNREINATLGFEVEIRYALTQLGANDINLKTYSIDGSAQYELGYIGCSKTKIGKTIIQKINKILIKNRANKISRFYEKWLSNSESIEHKKWLKIFLY